MKKLLSLMLVLVMLFGLTAAVAETALPEELDIRQAVTKLSILLAKRL